MDVYERREGCDGEDDSTARSPSAPIIILSCRHGMYTLDKDDMSRVLSVIGQTMQVHSEERHVLCMYTNYDDCYTAIKLLDGLKIELVEGRADFVRAEFLSGEHLGHAEMKKRMVSAFKRENTSTQEKREEAVGVKYDTSIVQKITCKYELDVFDDQHAHGFLLSKRIIGPKGSNMKKIIEECFNDRPFESDSVKLRLRGRGSGYREGPSNKECNEPLHMCISTKNQLYYDRCTGLIERLLLDICQSYDTYIHKNQKTHEQQQHRPPYNIRLYKKESSNNNVPVLTYPRPQHRENTTNNNNNNNRKKK